MVAVARQLTIAARLGRSLVATACDAARPGRALPLDPAAAATPAFLNQFNRTFGIGAYELPPILQAQLLDTRAVSSNCQNRVIALDYEAGTSSARDLPRSLFLKMPVTSLITRLFFNVIMSWELECAFYQALAARVPIRVPRAYAVGHEGSRFIMLLEDLNSDRSVRLHANTDMIAGPSLDTTRACLETLARLHAAMGRFRADEQSRLLPPHLHPFTSPIMRAIGPILGLRGLEACRRRSPGLMTSEHAALYQRTIERWDRLLDVWNRGPLTLIHGDSHLGNFFVDGDGVGMLDWQAVHWGKGMRDVQYFLIDSLPADLLATHEESLVRHYLAALADHGVRLHFAEAWDQYRGFSFQTWMTIVVAMGLGAMTEDMNEVMPEIHRRCIAAIDRLGFNDWLATHG